MGKQRVQAMEILELIMLSCLLGSGIRADSEANRLTYGCSTYKATNATLFKQNLNSVLASLSKEVALSGFATNEQVTGTDPVYGLAQCRHDKSSSDCVKCIAQAEISIRNCSDVSGGRAIFDGCFMRYESNNFYTQSTGPGDTQICIGENVQNAPDSFSATTRSLISDLCTAAPRMDFFFAAQSRKGLSNLTVYGLASCLRSVTEQGCRDCLNNAQSNIGSCLPHAEGKAVDAGCYLRYATQSFFPTNASTDLESFLSSGKKVSSTVWIIIGVVGGGVIVFVIILLILFRRRIYGHITGAKQKQADMEVATELRGPVDFDYKLLKSATNNFDKANKLGEGGYGEVYKGTLKNGKIVAVKKLTLGLSARAVSEFETEVKLISNVHHRNLVRLLGCCSQGPERLLVYEYMSKTSLDRVLFGESKEALSWEARFNIILGTARGLAYLHEDFHVCIIHRDIKSSNILLDENFQPKIADFGLARLLPDDKSHVTTRVAGTLGYTAPEYAIQGQLTEKADTYSYGVVVLQIISGRKSVDVKREPHKQYLLEWIWKLYEADRLLEVVDERMTEEKKEEEILRVIHVALVCIQASVIDRPTMSEVVAMVVSRRDIDISRALQPAFVDVGGHRVRGEEPSSSSTPSSQSNATVSTSLTAR